jgi:predicted nucleotidyltransferase component of viral defense system
MLTRVQIQRLAQRNGIGMQAQERDYIQHLLLFLLYSRSQELVFKGGTALRIVYHGNRYSEDLDFNGPADLERNKTLWQNVAKGLEAFGVLNEIRNEWSSDIGYSFDVSYQRPLYDGRDRTKGKVRVDINRRGERVASSRKLISPEYDDLRPFVITAIQLDEMLAEKMRALLTRGKPRDLYDIWLLTQQGLMLDKSLLEKKLAWYNLEFSPALLQEALEAVRADWERDLRPLLPQYIAWEEIIADLSALRHL